MRLTRILMANDFSPTSVPALELAADLARRFHAHVDVVHVWNTPPYAEEMSTAQMHRCVRSLQRRGITADGRMENGDPAEVILKLAGDYDLLILGTHGRRGLSRALVGSVAEAVVRRSPCPVLTVRPELEAAHV